MLSATRLSQTVLKQGPLELYERGSFVARHVEVCLRTPDDPSVVDVGCLVFRLKPARRELGGIELQSSLLSEAEQPDMGAPFAHSQLPHCCTAPRRLCLAAGSRCARGLPIVSTRAAAALGPAEPTA